MKSILIIGLGRFGKHMALRFAEQGDEVLAVDSDERRVDDILPIVNFAQIGDASNDQFMASLGINNFDLCVVAIGDNFQSSLEATAMLKDHGAKHVLARASSDVHKKFLLRNGADEVVYAERETAERLAVKYGSENVFDYIEIDMEFSIFEIAVPVHWIGKTIVGQDIRNKYHVSILATKQYGKLDPLPRPDHVFIKDETLLVMGHNEDVKELTKR